MSNYTQEDGAALLSALERKVRWMCSDIREARRIGMNKELVDALRAKRSKVDQAVNSWREQRHTLNPEAWQASYAAHLQVFQTT